MRTSFRSVSFLMVCLLLAETLTAGTAVVSAQDWPQWRGVNRDGKAGSFDAPETWPDALTQVWKVDVGDGVATPALVVGKLYVFARQEGDEILRCLDATTGKEIWQDKYAAEGASGPARSFSGPRSTPTVADGKVVTLGVQGTLSCLDTESGKLLWRNDDYKGAVPRFNPSSSPIVEDGLCIAHLGEERDGAIVAFDLSSGDKKWIWKEDGPSYGSPALIEVDGTKAVITPTASKMVALGVADGNLLWEIPYSQGRYNAASPVVVGQTVFYAGPTRGATAEKFEKDGDKLVSKELWNNADNSIQFNTPIVRENSLFGLSNMNSLFCINLQDGTTSWSASLTPNAEAAPVDRGANQRRAERQGIQLAVVQQQGEEQRPQRGQREQGGRRRRGGRGGGGGGGYGSIVNAGSVLMALTPNAQLVVFQPSDKELKQLASYKVGTDRTYAYPVVADRRIFVKDQNSVIAWTIQ